MDKEISFNLAKLLKEKGFIDKTFQAYVYRGVEHQEHSYKGRLTDKIYHCDIPAPTIAQVVMWLYEKYDTWIWVTPTTNEHGDLMFTFHFTRTNLPKFKQHNGGKYSSPKEAYETSIENILNQLNKIDKL